MRVAPFSGTNWQRIPRLTEQKPFKLNEPSAASARIIQMKCIISKCAEVKIKNPGLQGTFAWIHYKVSLGTACVYFCGEVSSECSHKKFRRTPRKRPRARNPIASDYVVNKALNRAAKRLQVNVSGGNNLQVWNLSRVIATNTLSIVLEGRGL